MAIVHRELSYSPALRSRSRSRHARWDRLGSVSALTMVGLALWLGYSVIRTGYGMAATKLDDVRYGYPRTAQLDGYIGYREASGLPTHLTAINAHRQVLIMILPGTEPSRVTVIKGPYLYGSDQELSPATLELKDVNGDGYNDLILHVAGQTITYLNEPRHHTFALPASQTGGAR